MKKMASTDKKRVGRIRGGIEIERNGREARDRKKHELNCFLQVFTCSYMPPYSIPNRARSSILLPISVDPSPGILCSHVPIPSYSLSFFLSTSHAVEQNRSRNDREERASGGANGPHVERSNLITLAGNLPPSPFPPQNERGESIASKQIGFQSRGTRAG